MSVGPSESFKTGAFNPSATHPVRCFYYLVRPRHNCARLHGRLAVTVTASSRLANPMRAREPDRCPSGMTARWVVVTNADLSVRRG